MITTLDVGSPGWPKEPRGGGQPWERRHERLSRHAFLHFASFSFFLFFFHLFLCPTKHVCIVRGWRKVKIDMCAMRYSTYLGTYGGPRQLCRNYNTPATY